MIILTLKSYLKESKRSDFRCEGDPPTEASALYDWYNYYYNGKHHLKGNLKCFCGELKETEGYFGALFKSFTYEGITSKVCLRYFITSLWRPVVNQSISIFITIMNMVLKVVIGVLISWVGLHSRSQMVLIKKNAVFMSMFFNTAIILLLINSDWSGTGIPLIGYVF
jgi:hypothetical protein